jgi:hypothetical protein
VSVSSSLNQDLIKYTKLSDLRKIIQFKEVVPQAPKEFEMSF